MFISYPIFDEGGIFSGVLVASIRSDTLGALVNSQLSPEIESDIEIVDPNGAVIYTSDVSIISENIFGDYVQAYISFTLSQQELSEFNDFLRRSLEGKGESQDFVING